MDEDEHDNGVRHCHVEKKELVPRYEETSETLWKRPAEPKREESKRYGTTRNHDFTYHMSIIHHA